MRKAQIRLPSQFSFQSISCAAAELRELWQADASFGSILRMLSCFVISQDVSKSHSDSPSFVVAAVGYSAKLKEEVQP